MGLCKLVPMKATQEQALYTANWGKVVNLIHTTFTDGQLPEEYTCQTVVLLPKGNGKFRGTLLVEFLWKRVPGTINRHIGAAVRFHGFLHGLRSGQGAATNFLKAKLIHQIMEMSEEVIYEVFLKLRNCYDVFEREICMEIPVK